MNESFYRKTKIEAEIRDKFPEEIEKLHLHETPFGTIEIGLIKIYTRFRNQGIASEIMDMIVNYADNTNKIVHLTPTDEYGSDKKELINFYSKFGFVKNNGKNKDFRIKDTMIKYPNNMNESRGFTIQELRKDAMNLLKSLGVALSEKNIMETVEKIKDMIASHKAGVVFENQNFSNRVKTFEEFMFEAEVEDF